LWLHSLKVAQLLRSAACLHTNQSRSYLNHLVVLTGTEILMVVIIVLIIIKRNIYFFKFETFVSRIVS